MRNSLYTVGILLTAGVLIIVALVLTWFEINEYKHGVSQAELPPPSAAPTPEGTPAEAPAGGAAAASQEEALSLAPSDALAIAVIDVERLRNSGALEAETPLQGMAQAGSNILDPQHARLAVMFASPNPAGPGEAPLSSGVVMLSASADEVRPSIEQAAETTTMVAGLEAYKVEDYYGALVGDDRLLLGGSTDSLAGIIERNEAGGGQAPAELTESLARYSGSMMRFAVVLPAAIKQQLSGQLPPDAPGFVRELNKLAGGLDMQGQRVSLNSRVTFDSAAAAGSAADLANQKLDEFKGQVAAEIQKMAGGEGSPQMDEAVQAVRNILDSISVSASGQDVEAELRIDLEEAGKAMGFFMMQMMPGMPPGVSPGPGGGPGGRGGGPGGGPGTP